MPNKRNKKYQNRNYRNFLELILKNGLNNNDSLIHFQGNYQNNNNHHYHQQNKLSHGINKPGGQRKGGDRRIYLGNENINEI
jgi:hypothetical protein